MLLIVLPLVATIGCAYVPEKRTRDVVHNPFPQMKRVAVLPFFNQSSEPTVNSDQVAEGYYAALQAIPGFEVLPVGVAKEQWLRYAMVHGEPRSGEDFQRLAQQMGVEALVVGSVTDFDPYYPPRMAMTVRWYAANEGFHTIPAGYGLPWGTDAEKRIPQRIAREAEFELARSQLATQTPEVTAVAQENTLRPLPPNGRQSDPPELPIPPDPAPSETSAANRTSGKVAQAGGTSGANYVGDGWVSDSDPAQGYVGDPTGEYVSDQAFEPMLPVDWPDPTDLIPDPPAPQRPVAIVSHEPVLSHTRLYRGDDSYFTNRLADYVETGDDARPGGWQDYLKRSEDFVRFCCHLHITEMLESRGGRDQSEFILRWPVSRY